MFQMASRREANRERSRPVFLATLQSLFPELETLPHADTLHRVLQMMVVEQMFVNCVIVADPDASKRVAKHLGRFFFAPANATAKQNRQSARKYPGITGFASYLPARFVNVHQLLQGNELSNHRFLLTPVFTELIEQRVGL